MAKTKVAKAKVAKKPKAKPKKRMSKGTKYPWEVWCLTTPWNTKRIGKFHFLCQEFKTRKQAEAFIKRSPTLIAPVIRHVDVPPVEY